MTSTDPRAAFEYRVPARTLTPGDLVNTGGTVEQDWQQVRNVYTAASAVTLEGSGDPAATEIMALIGQIGDRYVLVELSDIAPVDSNVYFADGTAYVFGTDGEDDVTVLDAVSDASAGRLYLYTLHELVTVRPASS